MPAAAGPGSGLAFGLPAATEIERIVDILRCAGLLPRDRTSSIASARRHKQRDRAVRARLHLACQVRPCRIRVNPTHSRDRAIAVELLRGLRAHGQLGTNRNVPIRRRRGVDGTDRKPNRHCARKQYFPHVISSFDRPGIMARLGDLLGGGPVLSVELSSICSDSCAGSANNSAIDAGSPNRFLGQGSCSRRLCSVARAADSETENRSPAGSSWTRRCCRRYERSLWTSECLCQ